MKELFFSFRAYQRSKRSNESRLRLCSVVISAGRLESCLFTINLFWRWKTARGFWLCTQFSINIETKSQTPAVSETEDEFF
jgi:hypothetical protein